MAANRKYNYLVADDETNVQKVICDILAIHPSTLSVFTASDGEKAYQLYTNNKIDIVITDVLMPRMSGLDLIKKIREYNPEANIIIVSASSNLNIVREAMRNGAYDYIIKPFSVDDIMFSINRIIERLKLLDEKTIYLESLEDRISEVTKKLNNSFLDALKVILNALKIKDRTIYIHSQNVADYSVKIARAIAIEEKRIEDIRTGAILHDIGKIGIPDSILLKPSVLTPAEFDIIREHAVIGRDIVKPMFGFKPDILDIIYYHHERYDGKGYPEGLKGEEIPVAGRLAAVANAFDAMITERPYKAMKSIDEAAEELKINKGTQFDPGIIDEFIGIL